MNVVMNNSFIENKSLHVHYCTYRGGEPAIELIDEIDGERYCVASVCIPGACNKGEIAIKNWSENEGVMEVLMAGGIIGPVKRMVRTGFVEATIHDLIETETTNKE